MRIQTRLGMASKIPFMVYLLGVLIFLGSCNDGPEDIDLDEVSIDFRSHRLDQDMVAFAKAYQQGSRPDSSQLFQQHLAAHKDFLKDWLFYGEPGIATDSVLTVFMAEFLSDTNTHSLLTDIQTAFPADGQNPLLSLENLLLRFKYYFPNDPTPAVLTFADGYPPTVQAGLEQVFITRQFIGVGIHYLMGSSYRYYPPDMPQYLRRRCNSDFLPATVAHQYADILIPPPAIEKNPVLIDHVVQQGLQLYLVDKLLGPEVPDSTKFYYTDQQMLWANTYEARAYKEMVDLLYEVDAYVIRRYTDDSPFTSQLARESAPRLGQFIGWKIVSQYAEKFSDESLAELIAHTDYQQVFKRSGYRPE